MRGARPDPHPSGPAFLMPAVLLLMVLVPETVLWLPPRFGYDA